MALATTVNRGKLPGGYCRASWIAKNLLYPTRQTGALTPARRIAGKLNVCPSAGGGHIHERITVAGHDDFSYPVYATILAQPFGLLLLDVHDN